MLLISASILRKQMPAEWLWSLKAFSNRFGKVRTLVDVFLELLDGSL